MGPNDDDWYHSYRPILGFGHLAAINRRRPPFHENRPIPIYLGRYQVNEWEFSSTFLGKVVRLDSANIFAPAPTSPRRPL